MLRRLLPAILLLVGACVPDQGPLMYPGEDCLSCHSAQGGAKTWTVAGTVFSGPHVSASEGLQGATVAVTDANGRTVSLKTNQAGNFYLADAVAFPLSVSVSYQDAIQTMGVQVQYGGCNSCHQTPGRGRISPFP